MEKPNIKSPGSAAIGFICAFAVVYFLSKILLQMHVSTDQTQVSYNYSKDNIHWIQGIFVLIGSMFGALVTSFLSPRREISQTIFLGISVITVVIVGAIRSKTQSVFDTLHVVLFISIIPSMLLIAYFVKKKFSRTL
ncbi:MAG: hypothetical protein HXY50_04740 [Ignavibacteriaceae bacterium]|nr:hypothetical protein [Ignavibacteriaceae bacterium]